jgi:ATP-binding cassette subfamily B protein
MSVATNYFADFVAKLEGFSLLPSEVLVDLLENIHPTRYRVGQRILGKEKIPDRIIIIYEGRVRLLGYDPRTQVPTTLKFIESGDVLGEIGILRQVGCEIAIASSEVTCLTLDATQYLQLFKYPYFAKVRKTTVI